MARQKSRGSQVQSVAAIAPSSSSSHSITLPQLLQMTVVASSKTALSPAMYSSLHVAQILGQAQSPHATCSLSLSPVTVFHTCYIQVLMAHCLSLAVAGLHAPTPVLSGKHLSIPSHSREGHLGLSEATLGTPILPAHTCTVAHCHIDGDFGDMPVTRATLETKACVSLGPISAAWNIQCVRTSPTRVQTAS